MPNRNVARQRAVPIAALPSLRTQADYGVRTVMNPTVAMWNPRVHPITTQRANPSAYFTRRASGFFGGFGKTSFAQQVTARLAKKSAARSGVQYDTTGKSTGQILKEMKAAPDVFKPDKYSGAKGLATFAKMVAGGVAAVTVGPKLVSGVKKIFTKKEPKYESDARLDAIAAQPIPDVSVLPSTARGEVLRSGTMEAISLERNAGDLIARANGTTDKSLAQKLRDEARRALDRAKKAKAAAEAAAAVATAVVPPSANPISPQGGYSVSDDTTPSSVVPSEPAQVQEAGMIGGMNPMVLLAAGAAFLLLNKRR